MVRLGIAIYSEPCYDQQICKRHCWGYMRNSWNFKEFNDFIEKPIPKIKKTPYWVNLTPFMHAKVRSIIPYFSVSKLVYILEDRLQFPLEKWLFKWSERWQAFWEKNTDCVEQTGPWAQCCPWSLCQTPRQDSAIVSARLYSSKHIVFVAAEKKIYNLRACERIGVCVCWTTGWLGSVWLFILAWALEGEILFHFCLFIVTDNLC